MNVAADDLLSVQDFSEFLHALRSRELRSLPADARTIVSGGCAAEWYFQWFNENFQGRSERHYGIELFADASDGLPSEVTWLRQSLGSMRGIADEEADLVFGGEVIEHLWPDDIAGFLKESWRVLRPGGTLALDSPNRIVCQAQNWTHPQHTLEFSIEEIVRVLGVAGFEKIEIRGVWLCYDRDAHGSLPYADLDGQPLDRSARIELARERPEDSFVWWTQAVRGEAPPDADRLNAELVAMYSAYRPERLARLLSRAPRGHWDPTLGRVVSADAGSAGVLFHGPYVPVAPGSWEACFRLSLGGGGAPSPETVVAELDIAIDGEPIASRRVAASELLGHHAITEVCVPFDLTQTEMGVEFRMISTGAAVLDVPLEVSLRRGERTPAADTPPALVRLGSRAHELLEPRLGPLRRRLGRALR